MDDPLSSASQHTEVFNDTLGHSVDINAREFDHQWKLYGARFEYAWRYFNFHATQRTTMFNFFIVFSGFLINACFSLLQNNHHILLLLASTLGTAITLFFVFLERRNEELVHVAEEILRALEKEVLFKDLESTIKWPKQRTWLGKMIEPDTEKIPLGIFIRQDYDETQNRKSKYFHGTWLPRIQLTIACMYLLLAFYSLYVVKDSYVLPNIYSFWHFVSRLFPG